MDPISQGALGAIAALSLAPKSDLRKATLIGWAGGMLADADVFIQSANDPLFQIEYHRHFSHSLIFIPLGGLACAVLLKLFLDRFFRLSNRRLYLYSTAGYATAGLLDACTSYGTQLLWPFSNARVAWNNISIIDPIFTLTILALLLTAYLKKRVNWGRIALTFAIAYLLFGVVQRNRAASHQEELAKSRGHSNAQKFTVKPSIGNLILWRSIYQFENRYYIDAIRIGPFSEPRIYQGSSILSISKHEFKKQLPENSILSGDIDRFAHFSDDYLSLHPLHPNIIGDVRYATLPDSTLPIWGIEYDLSRPERHTSFVEFHDVSKEQRLKLKNMLLNRDAN